MANFGEPTNLGHKTLTEEGFVNYSTLALKSGNIDACNYWSELGVRPNVSSLTNDELAAIENRIENLNLASETTVNLQRMITHSSTSPSKSLNTSLANGGKKVQTWYDNYSNYQLYPIVLCADTTEYEVLEVINDKKLFALEHIQTNSRTTTAALIKDAILYQDDQTRRIIQIEKPTDLDTWSEKYQVGFTDLIAVGSEKPIPLMEYLISSLFDADYVVELMKQGYEIDYERLIRIAVLPQYEEYIMAVLKELATTVNKLQRGKNLLYYAGFYADLELFIYLEKELNLQRNWKGTDPIDIMLRSPYVLDYAYMIEYLLNMGTRVTSSHCNIIAI